MAAAPGGRCADRLDPHAAPATDGVSHVHRQSAPFGKAIRKWLENADIVCDKFHVEKHLGAAVDRSHRQPPPHLLKKKDRRLAGTKYLWLRGTEHLSPEAEEERRDLLHSALETGKA